LCPRVERRTLDAALRFRPAWGIGSGPSRALIWMACGRVGGCQSRVRGKSSSSPLWVGELSVCERHWRIVA
jgi:hypothetical protein